MTVEKIDEYKMLREEIVNDLKSQKNYSTFAITATITIIGFALQTLNVITEIYLLSYIVLILASVKVHNCKMGMHKVISYMITNLEKPIGFSGRVH